MHGVCTTNEKKKVTEERVNKHVPSHLEKLHKNENGRNGKNGKGEHKKGLGTSHQMSYFLPYPEWSLCISPPPVSLLPSLFLFTNLKEMRALFSHPTARAAKLQSFPSADLPSDNSFHFSLNKQGTEARRKKRMRDRLHEHQGRVSEGSSGGRQTNPQHTYSVSLSLRLSFQTRSRPQTSSFHGVLHRSPLAFLAPSSSFHSHLSSLASREEPPPLTAPPVRRPCLCWQSSRRGHASGLFPRPLSIAHQQEELHHGRDSHRVPLEL
mmetsp:Transcript_53007/g.103693  ORF Transcript_53007/g.103693 Transcript_53007/m.103693 type:complete len:266 (-) Transcript_53007:1272-2069(-)